MASLSGSPPPAPYTKVPGSGHSTVAARFIERRKKQNTLHTLAPESVFSNAPSASVQKKDSLGTRKRGSDADEGQNGAQKKRRITRGPQGSAFNVSESEVQSAIGDLGSASGTVKRDQPQTQEPQDVTKLGEKFREIAQGILARQERSQGPFSGPQIQVPPRRRRWGPPSSALKALGSPEQSPSKYQEAKGLTPGGEEVHEILCREGGLPKKSPPDYVSPPPMPTPKVSRATTKAYRKDH